MLLIAGLSTGHKLGLLGMALVFIVFALLSSFAFPRRNPDYPGKGLTLFVIVSLAMFALMVGAVELFGVESAKGEGGGEGAAAAGQEVRHLKVVETEYRLRLPAAGTLRQAQYEIDVSNAGKQPHNLVVEGPQVNQSTPVLKPGAAAKLTVTLRPGNYALYCSVDGHRKLGMVAQLSVG